MTPQREPYALLHDILNLNKNHCKLKRLSESNGFLLYLYVLLPALFFGWSKAKLGDRNMH